MRIWGHHRKSNANAGMASILPEPMKPGLMRICPHCLRWFALTYVSTRLDGVLGSISVYRCKYCHRKIEFGERHPRDVI
jgi:hypothetical protein